MSTGRQAGSLVGWLADYLAAAAYGSGGRAAVAYLLKTAEATDISDFPHPLRGDFSVNVYFFIKVSRRALRLEIMSLLLLLWLLLPSRVSAPRMSAMLGNFFFPKAKQARHRWQD